MRRKYRVFVSHSGDDIWVAEQIARCIGDVGASTILDRRDIAAGDDFKKRIREEMPRCDERFRSFYKLSINDFRPDDDGLGPLSDINIVDLNDLGTYISELRQRAR